MQTRCTLGQHNKPPILGHMPVSVNVEKKKKAIDIELRLSATSLVDKASIHHLHLATRRAIMHVVHTHTVILTTATATIVHTCTSWPASTAAWDMGKLKPCGLLGGLHFYCRGSQQLTRSWAPGHSPPRARVRRGKQGKRKK